MTEKTFPDMLDAGRIAYIKPTGSAEAHRLGIIPPGIELPPGAKLYVLHAVDGSVLGYTDAYDSAYGAAVQNELVPVSLH
ncbi:MAG: DUF1150 family protein [Alphaproteobacteria bacterium]|nr:DUF1150 family protein [Alphaproteobacteria bacterium]MDE2630463.1 DUF1150 family protein [Alphaproteobacteria bacterium]